MDKDYLNKLFINEVKGSLSAAGGGSGGTSAPSDWDAKPGEPGHVLNRTHYREGGQIALDKTSITLNEGMCSFDQYIDLTVGTTYTIQMNIGANTYEFSAVAETFVEGELEIGTMLALSDNMIIVVVYPEMVDAIGVVTLIKIGNMSGEIELSIYVSETVYKMPAKYLPMNNILNGDAEGSLHTVGSVKEIDNYTIGKYAFAEGYKTIAAGWYSHAEGKDTTASNEGSHAEGRFTTAYGWDSHAEGNNTTASGSNSHAEGGGTTASGSNSHAEGHGTIAASTFQHVQGKLNIEDKSDKYAHIVGNGTSNDSRSNAHTLDWDGNAWFAGTVEGTALILTSPNGTRYNITVGDDGTLSATAIT